MLYSLSPVLQEFEVPILSNLECEHLHWWVAGCWPPPVLHRYEGRYAFKYNSTCVNSTYSPTKYFPPSEETDPIQQLQIPSI